LNDGQLIESVLMPYEGVEIYPEICGSKLHLLCHVLFKMDGELPASPVRQAAAWVASSAPLGRWAFHAS
jgi:hypothetical protein